MLNPTLVSLKAKSDQSIPVKYTQNRLDARNPKIVQFFITFLHWSQQSSIVSSVSLPIMQNPVFVGCADVSSIIKQFGIVVHVESIFKQLLVIINKIVRNKVILSIIIKFEKFLFFSS